MIPEPIQKQVSIDEFFELANSPHYSDVVVELVDGAIIEMTKPGFQHGWITNRLAFVLTGFVTQHRLGIVTAAETGYIVGEGTVRGIDIGFVSSARLPAYTVEKHFPGAPDLAVEVISPTNEAQDIHRKIRELLKSGAQIVWIVYPDTRTVDVWTADGAQSLDESDTLDGASVLPGFKLAIKTIFEM